jgi:hypothetical protein
VIDEEQRSTRPLTVVVVGLSGLLIASAALLVASPALVVGLLPGRLADPHFAHLTIRVVGPAVILLIALCLVAVARWVKDRLTGLPGLPLTPWTLVKGSIAAAVVAAWLIAALLPALAATNPGLLANAAPSVFADIGTIATAMLTSGLVTLGLPLLVAVVIADRYRARGTAAVLALVTVVVALPVAFVVHSGINRHQSERRQHRSECVYFVGGRSCPGD